MVFWVQTTGWSFKTLFSFARWFLQKIVKHVTKLVLPLVSIHVALVQGVGPFSVKIGLHIRICMCSFTLNSAFHQNSKIFSYNLALPLIYCWPTTALTTDHRPYRKHWQEMPEGLCMDLGWFELEALCKHRSSSWCCYAEVILGIQVSVVTYY